MARFIAITTDASAPTSRMVVNPASSVSRALPTDWKAESNAVCVTASAIGLPPSKFAVMWSWQSISPGNTVWCDRSITSAPAGVTKPAWTAVIRSSWIRIETFWRSVLVTPSISRPAWITTSFAAADPASAANASAAAATPIPNFDIPISSRKPGIRTGFAPGGQSPAPKPPP